MGKSSLTVSVDVKQHRTMLRHWFVSNMSTDIRRHEVLYHHCCRYYCCCWHRRCSYSQPTTPWTKAHSIHSDEAHFTNLPRSSSLSATFENFRLGVFRRSHSTSCAKILTVQARSRGRRWCWTLKLAQKRSRVGRWSWA